MIKKIISVILAVILTFSFIGVFSSCGSDQSTPLCMGEWLSYISDSFGMEDYLSDEPYISGVSEDDLYFADFQKAVEWDIISKDDQYTSSDKVSWKTALVTLVNAGSFTASDADDETKVNYAIEHFDTEIRTYWMKRDISQEDALILLAKATKQWASFTYDENVEKYEYSENFVELPELKSDDVITSDDMIILKNSSDASAIKAGSIFALPSEDNPYEKTFYKAESVKEENGNIVIKPSAEEPSFEEIYQDLYIAETVEANTNNTVFYDGNGNLISDATLLGKNIAAKREAKASQLGYTPDSEKAEQLSGKVSSKFTVNGIDISLSYNLDGTVNISVNATSSNLLGANVKDPTLKASMGFSVSNLKATQEVDMSWFKLKSAKFKIDYTVSQTYGLTFTKKAKAVAAPEYSNGNGKFLTNLCRSVLKADGSSGAKTIASKKQVKILSCNIYSVGVAKICLDFNLNISAEGSITLTVTENGSKGVEYKNGSLRFIKDCEKSSDLTAKAKVEFTIGFGPALYIIGLKKKLVGLEINVGVGIEASLKFHFADSQMHLLEEIDFNEGTPEEMEPIASVDVAVSSSDIQAIAEAQGGVFNAQGSAEVKCHTDTCLEISAYFILKVGLSDEAYLADLLGGKVTLSYTFFDSKNATFFKAHVDNFDWANCQTKFGVSNIKEAGSLCTLNYVPFDEADDEEVSDEEISEAQEDVSYGKLLVLNTMNVNMAEGQQFLISVTQLPQGYKLSDVVFEAKNDKIASIDANGVVTANKEGSSIVYAKTSDGKFKAMVAIIVETSETVAFEPLSDVSTAA